MQKIDLARLYLAAVTAADPNAVSALFTRDGVIDDFVGGRHLGRDAIERFVGTWSAGDVGFSDPVDWIEEGMRLAVYGFVQRPGEPERDHVRWVFHFEEAAGECLITHLGNSKIVSFPSD
ncbi:MAG: hypothetical protein GY910_16320 [bacterium]|nr:hypothetical protein [bacterium]